MSESKNYLIDQAVIIEILESEKEGRKLTRPAVDQVICEKYRAITTGLSPAASRIKNAVTDLLAKGILSVEEGLLVIKSLSKAEAAINRKPKGKTSGLCLASSLNLTLPWPAPRAAKFATRRPRNYVALADYSHRLGTI